MSWNASSQNGQKETGVYLNRELSVALVNGLIACDFAKKEVEILVNTIESKDLFIQDLKLQVEKGIFEIKKRDQLNELNKQALQLAEEINTDLSKALSKERKRKRMNKWFYFGIGVVGGVLGVKQLQR